MKEFFEGLQILINSGPVGQFEVILITLILLCVLMMILVPIAKMLFKGKGIKIGKDGLIIDGATNKQVSPTVSKEIIEQLIAALNTAYEVWEKNKSAIETQFKKKREDAESYSLRAQIESLTLKFPEYQSQDSTAEKLDKSNKILTLYLQRDFTAVFKSSLQSVFSRHSVNTMGESQILDISADAAEDCVRQMRVKIMEYVLLDDNNALKKLFENSSGEIKAAITDQIKVFAKFSKEEQEQIVSELEKREQRIKAELISRKIQTEEPAK